MRALSAWRLSHYEYADPTKTRCACRMSAPRSCSWPIRPPARPSIPPSRQPRKRKSRPRPLPLRGSRCRKTGRRRKTARGSQKIDARVAHIRDSSRSGSAGLGCAFGQYKTARGKGDLRRRRRQSHPRATGRRRHRGTSGPGDRSGPDVQRRERPSSRAAGFFQQGPPGDSRPGLLHLPAAVHADSERPGGDHAADALDAGHGIRSGDHQHRPARDAGNRQPEESQLSGELRQARAGLALSDRSRRQRQEAGRADRVSLSLRSAHPAVCASGRRS